MSQPSNDTLSATFAALADPTRRAILARLAQGDAPVGELVKPFPISGPAISRHLRVLENAGLIAREVDAQWRICRLQAPGLQVATNWLEQYRVFWEGSLDRLVEVLEQPGIGSDPASSARPTADVTPTESTPKPPAGTTRRRRPPTHHPRKKP